MRHIFSEKQLIHCESNAINVSHEHKSWQGILILPVCHLDWLGVSDMGLKWRKAENRYFLKGCKFVANYGRSWLEFDSSGEYAGYRCHIWHKLLSIPSLYSSMIHLPSALNLKYRDQGVAYWRCVLELPLVRKIWRKSFLLKVWGKASSGMMEFQSLAVDLPSTVEDLVLLVKPKKDMPEKKNVWK